MQGAGPRTGLASFHRADEAKTRCVHTRTRTQTALCFSGPDLSPVVPSPPLPNPRIQSLVFFILFLPPPLRILIGIRPCPIAASSITRGGQWASYVAPWTSQACLYRRLCYVCHGLNPSSVDNRVKRNIPEPYYEPREIHTKRLRGLGEA